MRAILFCPNEDLRKSLEQAVLDHDNLNLSKCFDFYPTSHEGLSRIVRVWAPEIVFISLEDPSSAEAACRHIDAEFPGMPCVAISGSQDPSVLRLALRLRVRDALIAPFPAPEFERVLRDTQKYLEKNPLKIGCGDRLFAFVPAKPGVGASTIAAGMTRAFASFPDQRTLLADMDSNSGVTGFLFNQDHEFSVADAARMTNNDKLDEESWGRLVRKIDSIDLLLSKAPRLDDEEISREQMVLLLAFMRRNYDVISVDLPDQIDGSTLPVLREANRIFLVTTPELASLRLARQKANLFRKLEIDDHVRLIINRIGKREELTPEQIEETVGLPVVASFPSDYAGVVKAIRAGTQPVALAASFTEFAAKLLNHQLDPKHKSRFIELFSIAPFRYGLR